MVEGFFDGDGSIYVNPKYSTIQIVFAGAFDCNWEHRQTYLEALNITSRIQRIAKTKQGSRYSALRITDIKSCSNFRDLIYSDYEGIGLERKYNKCQTFLKPPIVVDI